MLLFCLLLISINQRNQDAFRIEHQLRQVRYPVEIEVRIRIPYIEPVRGSTYRDNRMPDP